MKPNRLVGNPMFFYFIVPAIIGACICHRRNREPLRGHLTCGLLSWLGVAMGFAGLKMYGPVTKKLH